MVFIFYTNNAVEELKTKAELSNYSLVQSVLENKSYFLAQEVKGADKSRTIQEYLFYPNTTTFKNYVSKI